MAVSCGPCFGMTVIDGRVAGLVEHGLLDVGDLAVGREPARSFGEARAGSGLETASTSGPLTPAPNPAASWSYAWRCVASGARLRSSGWPSCRPAAGAASAAVTRPAASSANTGRLVAHGARTGVDGFDLAALRSRRGSSLSPALANRAGSSVTQTTAQTSTTRPGGDARAADERDAGDEQAGDRDEHDAGGGQRRTRRRSGSRGGRRRAGSRPLRSSSCWRAVSSSA